MLNTRAEFERLLKERTQYPERLAEIDQLLYEQFQQTHAIWIMDMGGFSRQTIKFGILTFLAMFQEVAQLAQIVISQHGGKLIKQNADNLFAVFPSVAVGVTASIDLFQKMPDVKRLFPPTMDIYGSVGIGYGEILMIGEEDFYGGEVNLACKLGEDLARPSEILLTESAYQQLPPGRFPNEKLEFSISGMVITAQKIVF